MSSKLGAEVAKARKWAHLRVADLAKLARLTDARVEAIERGVSDASSDEVARLATVFGVNARDLLRGEAARSPMRVLLRSVVDQRMTTPEVLANPDAWEAIGRFHQCVRDVAALEETLQITHAELPHGIRREHPEREALLLRLRLGLGEGPIPSMRGLLARLGVQVFATTPSELSQEIDGACTDWPRPAVLVNLVSGAQCFWRTRMTLAHELAHLLFDMSDHRSLMSPVPPTREGAPRAGRWNLFEGFDDIEVHADAFAACLLCPAGEVRRVVGGADSASEEAIGIVGRTFGVGRLVAINRLQHTFHLSDDARREMLVRQDARTWPRGFEADVFPTSTSLRGSFPVDLVQRALSAQQIGRARAHELLAVPLTAVLPVDGGPATALVTEEAAARATVQRHLEALNGDVELIAAETERDGDDWLVTVLRGGRSAAAGTRVGTVRVSAEGEIASPFTRS